MGISLSGDQLLLVLDESIARARNDESLPELWTRRVERIGDLGVRTYVAALGAALLAKATDPRIDSLAQDQKAGPKGYSLRMVGEFLALHNDGRFHMGVTGRWPLNNSPFLRGPARIDEFTKISSRSRPSYELFRDCMVDLNRMSAEEARAAFSAWLRVRMSVQEAERMDARRSLELMTGLDVASLVDVADRFVSARSPKVAREAKRSSPRPLTPRSITSSCSPSTIPTPATSKCAVRARWSGLSR